nr:hypothetical protein [Tanacetum cinerariifolium]
MHTCRDKYLINTLRFISAKEETQIFGAILPKSMTNCEMRETKAYKTYRYTTGATPPKKARNFKKPASPQLFTVIFSSTEPTNKSKRVKRSKEKVDVSRGKGIELLFQVALTEDAQFDKEEYEGFSQDLSKWFWYCYQTALSPAKMKPSITNEGTSVKPGVLDSLIDENEEDEDDKEEVKDEFVKTLSIDSDDDERKIADKAEGDEDEEMDYTTSHLYNDVDIRLNKPVDTDKGFVQEEGTDAAMTNVQQGNANTMILQVIEDAHAAATLIEFELKKILIDKMDKSKSYLAAPEQRECYEGLKKSYDLNKTIFSTYGKVYSWKRSRKDKDEDPSAGLAPASEEPEVEVADFYMPQDQEENPSNNDEEPKEKVASKRDWFTKPTQPQEPTDPDWNLEYDFEECYKALFEKLDWENPKGVTRVEVMRKHGYGYLQEIVVRRSNNDLYRFKEGDFPRLCINDIEDMLLLVVQNRLINLSGDDIFDFAIALRMFTRSLIIQKLVEDLQLGVKSYQKKIIVTKPETTKPTKKGPIHSISRPSRIHLCRRQCEKQNIRMEYLPKRRWSTLEKKKANIMVKAIDKHLKERRMTRSLKKFVGRRDYETNLRLLQQTI